MKTVKQVNNIKFTEREKDTIITSQSELPQDILKYAKKDSISSDLKNAL